MNKFNMVDDVKYNNYDDNLFEIVDLLNSNNIENMR